MKLILSIATLLVLSASPATADEQPPLLVDSPCSWFIKTAPDVWTTDRVIRVDQWGLVTGPFSFSTGTFKLDDGTDAYELVERKCGRGRPPRDIYRTAMPLPFGFLPWYR
jgi:hypothetical protein